MIKKTLTSNRVDQVDNVIHIADVHIRNFKRHDEYESVFQRVYDYCREEVGQNKNTIIYLAGDIVHAKTDMSPELIVMTRNFFVNLVEIAPVILIAGNHDMNLNNPNRLDALSPIVESIDTPDFFYLKETGVYTFGEVDFILDAVWVNPDTFIKPEDVSGDNIKVVLYHGAINNADIGFGQTIRNNRVNIGMFKGFDFGMFGDIHSFQYLDGDAKFAYAGSLIQQNFGEGLSHGVVHWNLRKNKSKFIPIKNDWAYYTIDIEGGKFKNLPEEFSPNNRVRVRSYNTKNSDLMKAITKLKSMAKIEDIRIQKFSSNQSVGTNQSSISIGDVRDVEHQNKLITSYLEKNFAIEDGVADEIRNINRELNNRLTKSVSVRNLIWNPVRFEFDNMFSYGENNWIDFTQMNGTYGIFAANASGKSSILDAISFCIFDKCSRTFKASQVLNNKKDGFRCKLHFQMDGKDYFIERIGTKDKKGHVKVNVNFWYDEGGESVSLNGEDRDGTNFAIRNYLGTYDDFIITALSLQGNNTNFIDKAQRERKDLLAQFLDLNLFEELSGIASDEIKSVQTLIKEFSRNDYTTKVVIATENYKETKSKLDELDLEKETFESSVNNLSNEILQLTKELKPVDDNLMGKNLQEFIDAKESTLLSLVSCEKELDELSSKLQTETSELDELQERLNLIDESEMKEVLEIYNTHSSDYKDIEYQIKDLTLNIQHNQSKIDNLSTHEYDPECKYCTNNVFVRDAKEAENILGDLIRDRNTLEFRLEELRVILASLEYVHDDVNMFNELQKNILDKQRKIHQIEKELSDNKTRCIELSTKAEKLESIIHSYIQNEGLIKENQRITLEISEKESERNDHIATLRTIEKDLITNSGQLRVYEKEIQDYKDSINKLQELETKYKAYDFYLKAVNRNGVPYELISEAIPKIQAEVNSILSQIVDFEILFEMDGKSINAYIAYDDENFWALEMTSGMEKFISSLAIRTALTNVSALPRPNFIAIDEGWGTLDSDNLNSLHMFFDYMKTQFDFILTISHIDALRDIVDSVVEINKNKGVSQVQY